MTFKSRDPNFERRVRASSARSGVSFGRVVRAGRTLLVVTGELQAFARTPDDPDVGDGDVVALLNGTMMTVRGRPDLAD